MRTIIAAVLAAAALVAIPGPGPAAGQGRGRSYREDEIGQYPNHWGDLVGVCSFQRSVVLVFKDGKGNLRRVLWNPGGVDRQVYVLARSYKAN